jgi:cytochrome c2
MDHGERHLIGCLIVVAAGGILMLGAASGIAYAVWRIELRPEPPAGYLGDPERGKVLVASYGCTSCHDRGQVGPPLRDMAERAYIAGCFPNDPIWMAEWLEHPQRLKPETAMPDVHVSEPDARDMAAYLATLRHSIVRSCPQCGPS